MAKNKLKKQFKKFVIGTWKIVSKISDMNDFLKLVGVDISDIDIPEFIDKITNML